MECDRFTCYLALGFALLKIIIIGIIFVLALKNKKKTRNLSTINVKLDSIILIINLSLTILSLILFMIIDYSTKTLIISITQILVIVSALIIQYIELQQNYPYSFFIRTILIVSIIMDTITNGLYLLVIIPIIITINILTIIALSLTTKLNKQRYDFIVPYLGVEIKQIQKYKEQQEKTIQEQLVQQSIQSELPEQFDIKRSLVKSQFSHTSKIDFRKQMFSQIIQSLQESEVSGSNFIPSRFRFEKNITYIDKKAKKEVQMYEIVYQGPEIVNDKDEKEEIRTGRSLDELNLLFLRIGLNQIKWETPPQQIKQILSGKINDPVSSDDERSEISKFFLPKFKLLEYL
ncbi:hypothetical protein pb186bvf_005418 [Paramecium bursaria]